jgi:hypothetical protein
MINLFLILGNALILLISTYTALIYGIRLGKTMQKDIPPVPIEPVKKAIKRTFSLVKDLKRVYMQKTEPKKEEGSMFD